jgi:hypothetical protein
MLPFPSFDVYLLYIRSLDLRWYGRHDFQFVEDTVIVIITARVPLIDTIVDNVIISILRSGQLCQYEGTSLRREINK